MNAQNGFTCLHLACQEGHVQIAKYLISAGANEKANNKVTVFFKYKYFLTLGIVW